MSPIIPAGAKAAAMSPAKIRRLSHGISAAGRSGLKVSVLSLGLRAIRFEPCYCRVRSRWPRHRNKALSA
jgi:hypothetical protein